jgi:hypothetical protein
MRCSVIAAVFSRRHEAVLHHAAANGIEPGRPVEPDCAVDPDGNPMVLAKTMQTAARC